MAPTIKQYLPSLGLVLAAALSFLATALGDSTLTLGEALNLGIVILTGVATYIVPRLEGLEWLKPATAGGLAALQALVSLLTDGITSAEWMLIGLSVLGALGVAVTNKNVPLTPRSVPPPQVVNIHNS